MSKLPQLAQLEFNEEDIAEDTNKQAVHTTFDWDFENGDFVLRDGKFVELVGIEYIKAWVQKALKTIKYSLIYEDAKYGSEHLTLVGTTFKPSFTKSEFERMIREALLQNNAITRVDNISFSQSGSRTVISFDVKSIYGTTGEVVTV
jgi:hypothetical protein